MGITKFFKSFFSTRKRKRKQSTRATNKKKNQRTKKHRVMRGGWGEPFKAQLQTPNVMKGGWGGVISYTSNNM